ncbi:iron-sulfur cluster insertion protein ErpA [Parvularcula lutaonensis]|uniref:Iron-sulfur cluster insertion protein ErpA n=1 Tax=Parvularcula lutaonensis TaxID=491923 RepID=A0ABV7MAY3_9PROT|nr:iron-sulfur cluster insertion protein ErpA [Parvularcula lutaonensis]GGY39271.1 heme biosynthesis protein HemY [Parvularcula lutaonensis]
MDVETETKPITMTDRAAKRVAEILASEPEGSMLRVAVLGGGCSGFQYDFEITTEKGDDDLVLSRDGATILIDAISQQYMPGAVIDFADELIAAAFKIDNPLAKSGCGCGTSFSI